jgi:hypothetical protein
MLSELRGRLALGIVIAVVLGAPAAALAHIERPSYWPDPAADTSVSPPAGGAVPKIRPPATALDDNALGDTRVVCQADSMDRLRNSISAARAKGYDIRPSDHRGFSQAMADELLRVNQALAARCAYSEIQPAITDSHNGDRVVIMPGVYTEPTSRSAPTHDPACAKYLTHTEFGDPGALSYAYQFHCPNDQNLIAVMGRDLGPGQDPDPPNFDRHGIPNTGPCIRCNLQVEGSGVSADDTVVDDGDVEAGDRPSPHHAKDVGFRVDRADGFVLSNLKFRHGSEQGLYVLETDGYVFDRFKAYYTGSYGVLTFVEDHGLIQNCDAKGHSDSGVYPGAPAETGWQRDPGTPYRYNQEVRKCDMHHNLAGYSGTDGNAVWIHDNQIYDNTLGLTTDVMTASGHPGFPGDSMLIEHNDFRSNNFDPYAPGSDVGANFPFPIGTGMWIAGGNHHTVRNNRFYDNWRRGTMLFSIPDALVCGDLMNNHQAGCDEKQISTSHYNAFYDNLMGVSARGAVQPNGTDFWWDAFPGSRGNCWYNNRGPRPITTSPLLLPACDGGKDPATSIGTGDPVNEGELLGCLVVYATDNYDPTFCPWLTAPARPGSKAAARAQRHAAGDRVRMRANLRGFCAAGGPAPTCRPFKTQLSSRTAALRLSSPRSLSAWGLLGPAWTGTLKPLSQFTCADWESSGTVAKRAIARRLTVFVGAAFASRGFAGWGTVLPYAQSEMLFDTRCRTRGSDHFLLYKLYGFEAAFAGLAPPMALR